MKTRKEKVTDAPNDLLRSGRPVSVSSDPSPLADERIVVIGGGMTGLHFVESLIAADSSAQITLICAEPHLPYDRIHLGRVLGGKGHESLTLRNEAWFALHDIDLRRDTLVEKVDLEKRRLQTSTGETLEYDRLVVATGGTAIRPPVPGSQAEHVVTYRSIEDATTIAERAAVARNVIVAGGGLLGLEAARALQDHGCRVEIIEMAPRLLPRQLDRDGATVLERQIRDLGIELRLLSRIEEIVPGTSTETPLEVRLTDGEAISTDLVVFAAGIRPNDVLARDAGIECHRDGGIEVDERLRTSDPNVFAIGECVRYAGALFGFVAPCYEMADVLAARLTGEERTFTGSTPSARLKIDEIDVAAVGESLSDGTTVSELAWVQRDEYRRIVLRDGRMIGAIAVGAGSDFPQLQAAVASRSPVRAWHRRRFNRSGRLWRNGGAGAGQIASWPDAAVVCTCTGVTCGKLRALREHGCGTRAALSEASGAGTVCGNCQPLLGQLVGDTVGAQRTSAGRALGVAALAGLALLAAAAINGPIGYATSVNATPAIDFLWRDPWWKQASGFSLLAFCVLSLGLSLRKRWPRFALGSFSHWRLLHATLGVGTVALCAVHSGFRLGENLNFMLMVCFLGLVFLGAGAGLVASLEHRLPPAVAGALRRGWTGSHVVLFWPIPLLVTFHVLAVYMY